MVDNMELSRGQKYAILTSLRVFECLCSKDMYCTNMALGVGVSYLLQLAVVWVLYRHRDILPSSAIRTFVKVYYALYGVVSVVRLVSLRGILPVGVGVIIGGVVLIGVSWYCASMGTKSLMRSALVVGFIVSVGLIVVLYGLIPKVTLERIATSPNRNSVLYYAFSDILHSVDLVLLIAIPTRDFPVKYLTIKAVLLEVLVFVGMGVLGGVSAVTSYPLMELATYSQPFGVLRCDALYTSITTLVCVLNISTALSFVLHSDKKRIS